MSSIAHFSHGNLCRSVTNCSDGRREFEIRVAPSRKRSGMRIIMMKKNTNKSYAVFGLGKFGSSVALELAASGAEVMVLDKDEERVSEMTGLVTYAMQMDATEPRAYQSIGLSNMDGVVVAMTGCLDASVMVILAAKEAGVPFILAKSQNDVQSAIFEKIGADKIVIPEYDGGIRAARSITAGNFLDFFELSKNLRMIELEVRDEWVGKNLKELALRQRHKINVVAIRSGGELTSDVNPDRPFEQGDSVMVIVDKKYIGKL